MLSNSSASVISIVKNKDAGAVAEEIGHWPRVYTKDGIHPFDQVEWKIVDAEIRSPKGAVIFEQKDIEVPAWWSQNAINIVADKYFRIINGVRENSVKQIFTRVSTVIRSWATEQNYFNSEQDAQIFEEELLYALVHQYGAFNSPVWFNLGVPGRRQAASACFISSVEDTVEGIMAFQATEATIFRGGSGSGANLSDLRSSYEKISAGSYTCGPLSWMKANDQYGAAFKSGGATRSAAKMIVLDMDHPDILETRDGRPGFIRCKSEEEKLVHDLVKIGYSVNFDDPNGAYKRVSYQNANNSVSIPDSFMQAMLDDGTWQTTERKTGKPVHDYKARDLWLEISKAAWICGDPGVQFYDTLNRWHTTPKSGPIRSTNPCAEFTCVDNTACNLCALNLTKFFDGREFKFDKFAQAVRIFSTSQMALVGKAEYPTDPIRKNSKKLRPIGMNYGDLGALLMKLGHGYDSDSGRAVAARLASLMTGLVYLNSAKIAARVGAFSDFEINKDDMLKIMEMHQEANANILKRWNKTIDPVGDDVLSKSAEIWKETIALGKKFGYNVSQASLQAPLGCLVAGSLIATDRGLIRIEHLGDIEGDQWQDINFKVQTDEGMKDATKFYVNGIDDIIKIQSRYGYSLRGTPKHQIKIIGDNGNWIWRRFDELQSGDSIPMAMNQIIGSPIEVKLPPLPLSLVPGFDRGVKVPIKLSPNLAELVGMFMANGSLHKKGLRFAVYAADTDVVEKYSKFINDIFGKSPTILKAGECTSLCLNSTQIISWWAASGFAKITNQDDVLETHIPDAILASNDRLIYGAYLRGLFTGDGSVNLGVPSLTNKSLNFIQDVQALLLALGIPTRLDMQIGGFSGKPVWRLTVQSRMFSSNFKENVGFSASRKSNKFEDCPDGLDMESEDEWKNGWSTAMDNPVIAKT